MPKPNEASSFASVAHKIGEPRLERALRGLASQVHNDIHNANFVVPRSEVRKAVNDLKANAQGFNKALDRMGLFHLFHLPLHDFRNARKATQNVIKWCDQGLSMVSGKGGTRKQPGRAMCALIVIEAWTLTKGKAPGANNHTVLAICDEYWRACENKPIGKYGDPRNWRTSMADALASRDRLRHLIRDEILRGME
jgi:hypothetical protein